MRVGGLGVVVGMHYGANEFVRKQRFNTSFLKDMVMMVLVLLRRCVVASIGVSEVQSICVCIGVADDSNTGAVVTPRRPMIRILSTLVGMLPNVHTGAGVTAGAGGGCAKGGAGAWVVGGGVPSCS